MSGRQKNAPKDPEAERAELRQLTRELHEAAQHAADEGKKLRAVQAEITADVTATVTQHVDAALWNLKDYLDEVTAGLQGYISRAESDIRKNFTAELAASGAMERVMQTCGMILHLAMPESSVQAWMASLKSDAAYHFVTGCECTGCLAVSASVPADELLGMNCPGCRQPAAFMLTQEKKAFCANDDCRIFSWNPEKTWHESMNDVSEIKLDKDKVMNDFLASKPVIRVGTAESLAALKEAGADLGMVIDMRKS